MLTISQVSKSFGADVLFEEVSLQVNRGDRLGLRSWGHTIDSAVITAAYR